ncbi:MAG TPA: hypothetical protein VLQ65_03065 [Saliniramus sp.]|nr:hypothetical protein [Saliniramus sp.]
MARFVFAAAIVYVLHALGAGAVARANELDNAFSAVPAYPSVEAVLEACHDDMIALCGDAAFRMDMLSACLRENEEILSPSCSTVQDDFRQRSAVLREAMLPFRTAATEACAADVASLCTGVPGGRATCLRRNADKVSPECGLAQETLRGAQRVARNLHRAN